MVFEIRKPQILVFENCGFWISKNVVFTKKNTVLLENCSFCLKTAVFTENRVFYFGCLRFRPSIK